MTEKNGLKTKTPLRYLCFLLFIWMNCEFHFASLLPENPYRFGDYTCDPNAYYIILGQIDVLRHDLIQRSVDKNLDIDFQAYKYAQKFILEKADVNKDHFISTAEIYNLNMQDFKDAVLPRTERTAVSDGRKMPDKPAVTDQKTDPHTNTP